MKFKQGDQVKMVNCDEAEHHAGRVWMCLCDSFNAPHPDSRREVVALKGFGFWFRCECLELVNKKDSP